MPDSVPTRFDAERHVFWLSGLKAPHVGPIGICSEVMAGRWGNVVQASPTFAQHCPRVRPSAQATALRPRWRFSSGRFHCRIHFSRDSCTPAVPRLTNKGTITTGVYPCLSTDPENQKAWPRITTLIPTDITVALLRRVGSRAQLESSPWR